MSDFWKKWKNKAKLAGTLYTVAAVWLSLGFVGYGIAAHSYVSTERRVASGPFGGPYQVLNSKVEWVDLGWFHLTDPRLKVEGNPTVFDIPRQFIKDSAWRELESALKPGVPVWFGYRLRDLFIVELQINPQSSQARVPVPHEYTQAMLGARLEDIATRATYSILFGLILAPAMLGLRTLVRRRRAS